MTERNETIKNPRAKWKPARRLETFDKDENMGYRFCVDESSNIERKQHEGWNFVNKTTGARANHEMEDAKTSGAKRHRELVLMAAPTEVLEERDAYHQKLNDNSARNIFESTKNRAESMGGNVDGKIVIE
jgi:hypothetical protein